MPRFDPQPVIATTKKASHARTPCDALAPLSTPLAGYHLHGLAGYRAKTLDFLRPKHPSDKLFEQRMHRAYTSTQLMRPRRLQALNREIVAFALNDKQQRKIALANPYRFTFHFSASHDFEYTPAISRASELKTYRRIQHRRCLPPYRPTIHTTGATRSRE